MRLVKPVPFTIFVVVLATGCQSGWVGEDGSAADAQRLEQARAACRVESRLEALERARGERDEGLRQAAANQDKMQVREDFASVERRVQKEIDACMRQRGFIRGGRA
jgi:hypothetical protein